MKTEELSLQAEFERQYPKQKHILAFLKKAIGKDVVSWGDITKLNMLRFVDYLSENLSQNSARTYLAVFKAFASKYSDENIIPCTSLSNIRIKAVPSQHIALTYDEVLRLDSYIPCNTTERDVLIIFMRGCLTGARYSDAILLTEDNISNGVLSYVSKKTHTEVRQPVHKLLSKYLAAQPYKIRNAAVMNRVIKNICRNVGIDADIKLFVNGKMKTGKKYEFVSEHTSRRTFCTILAEMSVPTETISKLCGHTNSNIRGCHLNCVTATNNKMYLEIVLL